MINAGLFRIAAATLLSFALVACGGGGSGGGTGSASLPTVNAAATVAAPSSPVVGSGHNPWPIGISPGSAFEQSYGSMSRSQQLAVIRLMKTDGVQWLRLDYYPSSTFGYQFIADAEAAGIDVDVLLEDWGATPSQFTSFSQQAVATLKPLGAHTYEILNEVNLHASPTVTAAQYVPLLQAAYTAIKGADASSTVLMSGLGPGPGAQAPATYLQAMYAAGAHGYFDVANLHPYSYPDMPEPSACPTWNTYCYGAPAMEAVMQQNGDGNKAIWFTEFGCPTGTADNYPADCTDATLAQQIAQAYTQARRWGWVGALFVFSWQDDADGDFGLYTSSGAAKPETLATFTEIANGVPPPINITP